MQLREPDTISPLWRRAAAAHGPRPFVTDLRNGNRTELSGQAFTQWVNKVANFLEDELPPQPRVRVSLPPGWLWPVCVAAISEIGGSIVDAETADAEFSEQLMQAPAHDVLAVHVHPMALPFGRPLPPRHLDFFLEVRAGGDYRAAAPGNPAHVLLATDDAVYTERQCIERWSPAPAAERLLVRRGPVEVPTADALGALAIVPWLAGAAIVIADADTDVSREGALTQL